MNIHHSLCKVVATMVTCLLLPAFALAQNGPEWLKKAVFYQIYPSSYMDSNGDGIGDIPGITSKLDYIKSVGFNAIWLNPVFVSGWYDGGYDVIDFYQLDPRFGTNTDFVTFLNEAHKRGIRVCLDLVAGHTSDKCRWFKESSQADANLRYSDYYIWTNEITEKDKEDIELRKKEKNTLIGARGRYVEANVPRAKYYEKNFFECQPALNYGFAHPDPNRPWEQHPDAPGPQAVRRELRNIMAFWLDKGVDGFRVDMASSLVKNDEDGTEVRKLWKEMRKWKDRHYPEAVFISEWSDPLKAIPAGFDIDFMIHFGVKAYIPMFFAKGTPWGSWDNHTCCYFDRQGKGSIKVFTENFTKAYNGTKAEGYIALPSANHDFQRPNIGTRNTFDQLKVAMTFFLTMPGVPFIYYGDEIGMKYLPDLPSKEGSNERAGTRTPMQWSDGSTAGFSTCPPEQLYLPVDTENGKLTVEAQEKDSHSLLNFVRHLITLRQTSEALGNTGDWQLVSDVNKSYPMVYKRTKNNETYLIALNPSDRKVEVVIASTPGRSVKVSQVGKVTCKMWQNKQYISMRGISSAIFKITDER